MLLLTVTTVMRGILSLAKALGNLILMIMIMLMKALEEELMVILIGAVMYLMKVLDHPVIMVRLKTVQIVVIYW